MLLSHGLGMFENGVLGGQVKLVDDLVMGGR